ncbi:glycosyltransferase family 2 protein [Candidatus Pelagibacter sp. Uisw_134_02]|uniref:glycosyltransferase family 2 protein n=1 Tax=Candidatus Pelagibacter sp. Uisw_134_02 TaxID=3230990 RepID=UPI0039E75E34
MKISLALPFHNEKENLFLLLPLIEKNLLQNKDFNYEVNLVDDISDDGSYEFCKEYIASNSSSIVFNLFKLDHKGYQSGALKKAFYESTGDFIITMDTDLQDDPKYLPTFLNNISKGNDVIIGVRKNRKAPAILSVGLKVYDLIFEIMFHKKITTYRAPYVAYRYKYVSNLPWFKNDHRYLIPMAINRGANLISEFEVILNERKIGKSHYNKYLKVFWGIIELGMFVYRMKSGKYK